MDQEAIIEILLTELFKADQIIKNASQLISPMQFDLCISKHGNSLRMDSRQSLFEHLKQQGVAFCRVCGCTEHSACDCGCYWVEDDLCSACATSKEDAES